MERTMKKPEPQTTEQPKTERDRPPFTGMGIAAYAMMHTLLSAMVNAGQGKEALIILDGAKEWLSKEGFDRSSHMREARKSLANVEKTIRLQAQKPKGLVQ
jgi:hypothetical protein